MSQPEPLRESAAQAVGHQGKGLARRFYVGLAMGLIPLFMIALVGLGSDPGRADLFTPTEILVGAVGVVVFWMLGFAVWARNALLRPLTALDVWASKIRQGDFSARLSDSPVGEIKGLTQNIDRLSEWLEALAQEREQELQIQRERLEQRAQLANELHDSLAQTLASLKFQVRVLDDTLRQDSEQAIWHEMERIEGSIDEANLELRELIAHFRAPQSEYGLVSGIQRLLSRLRKEAGIEVVLQNQSIESQLDSETETQLLRIVQEALANVRKHSRAHMVRVLLTQDAVTHLRIVIEDDGEGMSEEKTVESEAHHFGLEIMRERAESIQAELTIESEPGEGTRVAIELNLQAAHSL